MPHTDVLVDHQRLTADPHGVSAGNGAGSSSAELNTAGQVEKRDVGDEPGNGGARLSHQREPAEESNSGVRTQKKLRLCRYFGTPGGEYEISHWVFG